VGLPRFLVTLTDDSRAVAALREPRLQRAIGVVYRPDTERQSHYFEATLPGQFDALLHFDRTRGVEPLDRTSGWETEKCRRPSPLAYEQSPPYKMELACHIQSPTG